MSQWNDDVRSLIPSADICNRTLRNQLPTPTVPRLLKELGDPPTELALIPKNFYSDNKPNSNHRILVFGTSHGVRLLGGAMAPIIFRH